MPLESRSKSNRVQGEPPAMSRGVRETTESARLEEEISFSSSLREELLTLFYLGTRVIVSIDPCGRRTQDVLDVDCLFRVGDE